MRLELKKISEKNNINNNQEEELNDLKNDFTDFFQRLNKEVKVLKDKSPSLQEVVENEELNNESIKEIISTSSEGVIETNQGIVDSEINNCPKYINCMPTIGQENSCVIPQGCEGITIPVY